MADRAQAPLNLEFLFALMPANQSAYQILDANRRSVFTIEDRDGLRKECVAIRPERPTVGRDKRSGIWMPGSRHSRRYCQFSINPSSGELVLHRLTKFNDILVDKAPILTPAQAAIVYGRTESLVFGDAAFKVFWPPVPRIRMDEYRQLKREVAGAMLRCLEPDATDDELDLSMALTRRPTAAPSIAATPSWRQPGVPIKLDALGQGSFGTVYLAVERHTADFVAVKSIRIYDKDIEIRNQKMQNLGREIDILRELRHVRANSR